MLGMLADFVYNHLIKADDLFILGQSDLWTLIFGRFVPQIVRFFVELIFIDFVL